MGYSDPTIQSPAQADQLTSRTRKPVEIGAQPAQLRGGRTVILRIQDGKTGKRTVYEISLAEWSRLNRDARLTP